MRLVSVKSSAASSASSSATVRVSVRLTGACARNVPPREVRAVVGVAGDAVDAGVGERPRQRVEAVDAIELDRFGVVAVGPERVAGAEADVGLRARARTTRSCCRCRDPSDRDRSAPTRRRRRRRRGSDRTRRAELPVAVAIDPVEGRGRRGERVDRARRVAGVEVEAAPVRLHQRLAVAARRPTRCRSAARSAPDTRRMPLWPGAVKLLSAYGVRGSEKGPTEVWIGTPA